MHAAGAFWGPAGGRVLGPCGRVRNGACAGCRGPTLCATGGGAVGFLCGRQLARAPSYTLPDKVRDVRTPQLLRAFLRYRRRPPSLQILSRGAGAGVTGRVLPSAPLLHSADEFMLACTQTGAASQPKHYLKLVRVSSQKQPAQRVRQQRRWHRRRRMQSRQRRARGRRPLPSMARAGRGGSWRRGRRT
jgi:hypothetical protein